MSEGDNSTNATIRSASETIARLSNVSKKAGTAQEYYRHAFHVLAEHFGSPYSEINVRIGASSVEETHRNPSADPSAWLDIIDALLLECESESQAITKVFRGEDGKAYAALSSPVRTPSGGMIGATVVAVPVESKAQVAQYENELSMLTSLMASHAPGINAPKQAAGSDKGHKALAKAADYTSIKELAYSITNGLASKLNCEQVSLGLVKQGRVKILSISGMDDVPKNTPGVIKVRHAMEECLDRGTPISCRKNAKGESKDTNRYLLHEQWSESANNAAVCSLPVTVSDQIVAVVSMRRKNDDPFTPDEVEKAQSLLEPFAPAILVVEKANRSLPGHLLDAARTGWIELMKPKRIGRKLAALAFVALTLWFLFGTMTYSVTVPCSIAPAEVRHISAPFEAVIADAPVRAGDHVVAGQVMVRFDTSQLELERQRLISELRVSEIEKRNAISGRDLPAAALADANMNVLKSQLETTERQIEQSIIRAYADGTVVKGDLRKRIGQSVRPDETLFELAPSDDWYVELQIPEVHAPYITSGLSGSFATLARPDQPLDCEVERVVPSAEVVEGKNVFLAQTRVPQNPEWMRVGMEGVARIDVGPKPVWWAMTHRAIDFIRMKLWL